MSLLNLNDSFENVRKGDGNDSFISKNTSVDENYDLLKKERDFEFNVGGKNSLYNLNKNIDELKETFNNNSNSFRDNERNRTKTLSFELEKKLDKLLEKTKQKKENKNLNVLPTIQAKENQNINFMETISILKEKETNLKRIK